jgi:hypothetical protein
MKSFWLGLLLVPTLSWSQSCPPGTIWDSCGFGPNPNCIPGCKVDPPVVPASPGPKELCIRDTCAPVVYSWIGSKVVAESVLINGYEVMGWSGPCFHEDRAQCPHIFDQAFLDLQINAYRADRAQIFNTLE